MTTQRETGGWTAGPWKLDEQSQLIETASPNLKGEYEHICDFRADWNTEKINLANARLIAAAPEMVEALDPALLDLAANELAAYGLQFNGIVQALTGTAMKQRAALAKARGEGL